MTRNFELFCKYTGASMIGMLIGGSFSIVDTIFLGRGTGELGLAAVALTWPLIMVIAAFGDAYGMGAAALISQARGSGETGYARKIFADMILMTAGTVFLVCMTVIPLLPWILRGFGATQELMANAWIYSVIMIGGSGVSMLMMELVAIVRNDGKPMLSTVLIVIGLLGNAVMDWLFIMQFQWGAAGAAAATIASQGISAIGGILYFCFHKTDLKLSRRDWVPEWRMMKEIFVAGIPIFGNSFSVVVMLFLHNFQALRYAHEVGLAAYTMIAGLESLGSMLMFGLAEGVQPLAAYYFGARQFKRQNQAGRYGYWTAFILGIGLMLFSFSLRHVMPEWVGLSGETARLASHGILLSSSAFILLGVIRVAAVYYQSTGKILDSSLLTYGDSFAALPLCLFVLPVFFGMNGVWLAMPVSRILLFLLLCWLWFGKKSMSARKCVF